ncbi:MAG TPA: hypothetical protein VNY77_00190 [Candidatus Angelobacter sp.]|nr:hypothetical protein [Candidatus Angelobacter sp.]
MKIAATALFVFCALTACVSGVPRASSAPPTSTATPPSITTRPSSSPSGISSPPGEPFTTKLTCGKPVTATHGLALYELATTPPILEVLDVSNPLKPALLCLLSPAQGGSFDQAPNEVVFWIGDQLGAADLSSGQVVLTARLPMPAYEGVFSHDGATFVYRASVDPAGSISTRIDGGGYDRELYLQAPLGGHGGPPPGRGPFDQLAFSADGTELLDFNSFRPPSGPDNFLVYRTAGILGTYAPPDSFLIFHSTTSVSGAWAPTGSTLYFFTSVEGTTGEVDSLDATGQRSALTRGVTGFYWPQFEPSRGFIFYDAYTSPPGDSCGGVPHLWLVSLRSSTAVQSSLTISSEPVVISQDPRPLSDVVWSNEEKPVQCGPGGETIPDGAIVAYYPGSGGEAPVDMSATVPGIGGPPLPPPSTHQVLDVWF